MAGPSPEVVEELFQELVDLDPARRGALLDARCAGDPELRAAVEELLDFDARAGETPDFLRGPASDVRAALRLTEYAVPASFGRYRVLRRLGEGGMGTVYEAEQDSPPRTVALKVIRRGADSAESRKRFAREARILGRLDHVGIARVFDSGTTDDGRLYLAMEYVRGLRLDEHARRRALDIRARLDLVARVCDAVQHAHEQGVVHRDLKPANLLVSEDGEPKVLDFGVAQATGAGLSGSTLRTRTGQLIGTLGYMSPEQVAGDSGALDARSDVYTLGVILFELLAGRLPYRLDDLPVPEVVRVIRDEEPSRLGATDRRFRGEVETIVARAMEKDRARRYQSAGELAEDLRRHLARQPIRARRVGAARRYWRWARRNPWVATLGGALMTVMVATTVGSVLTSSHFRRLAASEADANRRSREAERGAILERDRSRQLSANLALDKGLALAEEGHADRGLLWMLEALKAAPDDADGFRKTVRRNLGAWLGQVPRPLRFYENDPGNYLAFSPDGRTFAQSDTLWDRSSAKPVSLRDTDTGRVLASFPDAFSPFGFRPDGRALVAGTKDGRRMAAFDLATGRAIWESPDLPGGAGRKVAFDADGATVFVERDQGRYINSVVTLDVGSGRRLGGLLQGPGGVAIARDARWMAVGRLEDGQYHVEVIDAASGGRMTSWQVGGELITGMGFSPDGRSLFVQSTSDVFNSKMGGFRIWDPIRGRPRSRPVPTDIVDAYFPAGDRLTLTRDSGRAVVDAAGRERGSLYPVAGAFALHPDGRTVLSHDVDFVDRLWQVSADAEPVRRGGSFGEPSMPGGPSSRKPRGYHPLRGGRLRADGQVAALLADDPGGRELIRLVDPATDRPLGVPLPHDPGMVVRSVAFSPDGRRLATSSNPLDLREIGVIRLRDANTGRLLIPPIIHTNYAPALAFHPGGGVLAAGDYNGLVRFWDTGTGREIGRPLYQGEIVLGLAYSPDGKVLAVGLSREHKKPGVRLWDTATRQPIGELLPSVEEVERIVFRPDGGAFLGGNWQSARLWDTNLRRVIGEPMVDEAVGVFHPDGRAFLTLGKDGSVRLRDAATGAARNDPLRSTSPAVCAAFRGDGGLVAAGFDDGAVRLWDPAASQQVGPTLSMNSTVRDVGFSPDGRAVYAIDDAGELRQWPVRDPLRDSSLDDLAVRLEARTGLRMDATSLAISRLDPAAWRVRLGQLGRLDPAALRIDDGPAWHEPMAREAERVGNAYAAIWHLDRLIAARPDDWLLHARRAHAWCRSDRFDRAAADYQEAERLGNRGEVLDFQDHRVVESSVDGHWAEALWYLDRLIAARPDDGSLHASRAEVCGKLGREAERRAGLARVFELGADEGLVIPRAEEIARAGRWPEAAGLLARCGRRGPLSHELAQAWGIACLRAGDLAGYREACEAFKARLGPDPTVLWDAWIQASLLALSPGNAEDHRVPIAWFERRLSASPTPSLVYRHVISSAQGGLLLRAGRIDEAIAVVEGGISAAKQVEIPADWAYLALAHARKGRCAEARRWLDRLQAYQPDPREPYWKVQELAVLREEAESSLLDAAFPSDPLHHLERR